MAVIMLWIIVIIESVGRSVHHHSSLDVLKTSSKGLFRSCRLTELLSNTTGLLRGLYIHAPDRLSDTNDQKSLEVE